MTREEILKKYPNATEQQVSATLAYYNKEAEGDDSWMDIGKGVARSVGQGLTFGFGDEITALARSVFGRDYDELVQEERDALNAFRDTHPELAYGAEILSGFALPGVGLAKGLTTAAKVAATTGKAGKAVREGRAAQQVVARQPMTAANVAKIGATQGGLYGVGAAEGDLANRALGGAVGAATGGVLSPIVARAADPVIAARNVFRSLDVNPNAMVEAADKQAKRAAKRIMGIAARDIGGKRTKELAAEGKAPTEAYRETLESWGPDAMIADVSGPRGKRFVSGITQGSTEAASMADDLVTQRASKEFDRITKEAARLMNARTDATRLADVLDRRAASLSKPIYKAAEKGEGSILEKSDFAHYLVDNADDFKPAYEAARKIARREGNKLPSWDEFMKRDKEGFFEEPTVGIRTMQLMKIALDDAVDVGKLPTSSLGRGEVNSLGIIRDGFNDRLAEFNPTYKAANIVRKVGYDIKNAVEAGTKFRSVKDYDPSDVEFDRVWNTLKTDIERKAFRSGMLEDLKVQGRNENVSLANKINRDIITKDRLRKTFPDDESFDDFMRTLTAEKAYGETRKIVTGGSRTARTGTEIQEALENAPGQVLQSTYEASINPGYAAVQGTGRLANYYQKFRNRKLAEEAANIEFTKPGEAVEKLDQLQRIYTNINKTDQALLQQLRRRLTGATTRAVGSGISTFADSPNVGLLVR